MARLIAVILALATLAGCRPKPAPPDEPRMDKYAVGYLGGGEVGSIEEIRPGCGAVMRFGLHKTAVYRDANGDFHGCSAVCPHLGAVIAWNDATKTWDCPAHGSRFGCEFIKVQPPGKSRLAEFVRLLESPPAR